MFSIDSMMQFNSNALVDLDIYLLVLYWLSTLCFLTAGLHVSTWVRGWGSKFHERRHANGVSELMFSYIYKIFFPKVVSSKKARLWVGWISVEFGNLLSGGAVVYWIGSLTRDQMVVGSIPVNAWHFCPLNSKTLYPHCCSPPRCINGYPVGCEHYLWHDVACVRPWSGAWPECSPGSWEGALWVQDWHWIQWLGVIIHCKSLCVVSHTRKVLYKN